MSLQIWLPLNGSLKQIGISSIATAANNGATINNNGKIGKCYNFDGTQYIDTGYYENFGTGDFTLCAWIYLTQVSGKTYQAIISNKTTSGASIGCAMYWNQTQKKFLWSTADGSNATEIWSADAFDTIIYNSWHHIIMVRDNSDAKKGYFYLDGIRYELASVPAIRNVTNSTYSFKIGTLNPYNTTYSFTGNINDIRIYDHAISAKEAKEISKGLVAHYQLSDNSIEGTTNLCTGLAAGNRTTLSSDGLSVTTNGTEGDTYFDMKLSEGLVSGTTYTISMNATGMPAGKEWIMRLGNLGDAQYLFSVYNGYNELTFTANDNLVNTVTNRGTKLLIDDGGGAARYTITTFSHCQLEKKDHATLYVNGTRAASTFISDSSGYGNNGTVWKYDTNGNISITSNSPRYMYGTFIDSANNTTNTASGTVYIYGNCELTAPNNLTVAFWCKPVAGYSGSTTQGQFCLTNNPIGESAGQDYNSAPMNHRDGTIDINSVATVTTIRPNIDFTANEWHHYAVVYNGRYGTTYKDGILYQTKDFGSNKSLGDMKGIVIAFSRAGGVWRSNKSYYSDFRLYTTALSADDIKELYQSSASVDNKGNAMCYEIVG